MGDTYESLNELLGTSEQLFGKNSNGENVIVNRGDDCVYTETFQSNDWVRTNYYYEDGTVEELFTR